MTSPRDDLVERPGVHPVEKLWREVGLPEYFLGNGGTNTKLYALYDAVRAEAATRIGQQEKEIERLREALREILDVEKEFREQMPHDWEGDPLTEACDRARSALNAKS